MTVPKSAARETIFYDGHCGLCHWTVKFVLARDHTGRAFRFAPLDSESFRRTVPESERSELPDSIVVRCADGSLLTKSTAVVHILRRLGGGWRWAAALAHLIPAGVRDGLYDLVARIRRRLLSPVDDVCPTVPPHWRARFDA